jgi:sugar O-acyltransferase (sialic acid O-acetyltransferase NeuD family)
MKPVVIVTAGGLARTVYSQFKNLVEFAGFMDTPREGDEQRFDLPVKPLKEWDLDKYRFVIVCRDPERKRRLVLELWLKLHEIKWANLIHPLVQGIRNLTVGVGSVISRGAIVNPDVTIGSHVYIGQPTLIGHDSEIGDYSTILSFSHISGYVYIGSDTLIGSHSFIKPHIKIGRFCVVGAGAVVVNDVLSLDTVVGIPAKPLVKTLV